MGWLAQREGKCGVDNARFKPIASWLTKPGRYFGQAFFMPDHLSRLQQNVQSERNNHE